MERLYDVQVLVIGIRSEYEARLLAESLPSELESKMVNVETWEQFRQALREHPAPIVHIVSRSSGPIAVELQGADGVMRSSPPAHAGVMSGGAGASGGGGSGWLLR